MSNAGQIIQDVLLYFTRKRHEPIARVSYSYNANVVEREPLVLIGHDADQFFESNGMQCLWGIEHQHMLGVYRLWFNVDRRRRRPHRVRR